MEDRELEGRLGEFDFSLLSPVREPLREKLLSLRRSREAGSGEEESLWARRLDDEVLDEVAAAGSPAMGNKPRKKMGE